MNPFDDAALYETRRQFFSRSARGLGLAALATMFGIDRKVGAAEPSLPHFAPKARRAVYHHNSFRGLSPVVVERHFVRQPAGGAQVKEAVRRLVQLRHGNLVEAASYEGLGPLDAVFCRNVLIYFSDAMILRVVRFFHEVLAPGGYLFLGHAESLSRITDLFTPIRFQGAMVYQKAPSRPRTVS